MDRRCNCCGEALLGRSDKRFCNDACRSQHYHLHHQKEREKISDINRILRNNRRILLEWRSTNEELTYKDKLLQKGFCFEYYTHFRELDDRKAYFCYDLGYVEEGRARYKLISDQEERF
ncbi:MAG: hypothetical protein CMP59_06580 [Flavobacteriales bacterium]|nr:hypothetical protein [Flavobacteriales bacterium]